MGDSNSKTSSVTPVDITSLADHENFFDKTEKLAEFGKVWSNEGGYYGYRGKVVLYGATCKNIRRYAASLGNRYLAKKTGYVFYMSGIHFQDYKPALENLEEFLSGNLPRDYHLEGIPKEIKSVSGPYPRGKVGKVFLYIMVESYKTVFNINMNIPRDLPCQMVTLKPKFHDGFKYSGSVTCMGGLTKDQVQSLKKYLTDGGRPMQYRNLIRNDFRVYLKIFALISEQLVYEVMLEKKEVEDGEEEEEEEEEGENDKLMEEILEETEVEETPVVETEEQKLYREYQEYQDAEDRAEARERRIDMALEKWMEEGSYEGSFEGRILH